MSDARWYAVWPKSRSRSRALQSWKSGHFQKLSPPPFITGAGNWHRFLISKFDLAGFLIIGLFSLSREVGTNVRCEESTVSPCTRLIFLFHFSVQIPIMFPLMVWHHLLGSSSGSRNEYYLGGVMVTGRTFPTKPCVTYSQGMTSWTSRGIN